MRTNLKMMAAIAAVGMTIISCGSDNENLVRDVVLGDCPTPSSLITDPRYRLPTRLEAAQVLKYADGPDGCWQSKQRIMCMDSHSNGYYTFVPHGTVTKAGMKTKYCILPIRTERTSEEDHVDITVNDEWG
jgi:hypothetical protein